MFNSTNDIKRRNAETADRSIGPKLDFAATEAYKKLRTNILYCLPSKGDNECRVISVTSSLAGEGKTTVSINLSYTLAEMGKKVVLIEADMRLPNIAKRIGTPAVPGLSEYLVSSEAGASIIKRTPLHPNLYLVPAGTIPPNPSELLGSSRMGILIQSLSKKFDFIIIDQPPIGAVTDAIVVSKQIDGMLVVVREGYANKRALAETMRQIKLSGAKPLGIVMNDVGAASGKYGYMGKSSYYRNDYYKKPDEK